MPRPGYTIMPGDWTGLEIAINDLVARILTTDVDTSTIVSAMSAIAVDVSIISNTLSAVSDLIGGVGVPAVSQMASANSNEISTLSNALEAISDQVSDLIADVAANVTEIDAVSDMQSSLITDIAIESSLVTDVHSSVTINTAAIADNATSIATISNAVTDVDTLADSISAEVTDVDTLADSISAEVTDVDTLADTISGEVTDVQTSVTGNATDIGNNSTSIATISNAVTDVDTLVDTDSSLITDVRSSLQVYESALSNATSELKVSCHSELLSQVEVMKDYADALGISGRDYFLSDTDDPIIADYHVMYTVETGEGGSTEVSGGMTAGDDQLMFSFITEADEPGLTYLRPGMYEFHTHLNLSTGDPTTVFYWTLSKRLAVAPFTEVVLMMSEVSDEIPITTPTSFVTHAFLSSGEVLLSTDRLVLKLRANVTGGGTSYVTISMEGNHDCHLTVKVPSDTWLVGEYDADYKMLVVEK